MFGPFGTTRKIGRQVKEAKSVSLRPQGAVLEKPTAKNNSLWERAELFHRIDPAPPFGAGKNQDLDHGVYHDSRHHDRTYREQAGIFASQPQFITGFYCCRRNHDHP